MPNRFSIKRILIIAWLVFSSFYLFWNEWGRFKAFVTERSYAQGVSDAVGKVLDESSKCQPFPVNVGDRKATLISVECLQKAQEGAAKEQPK